MHHEHSIKTKQKEKKKGHGYAILMYTYIAIYFIHKKWNGNFNLYTIMLLTAKRKRKAVALTETKQGHFLHYSTVISRKTYGIYGILQASKCLKNKMKQPFHPYILLCFVFRNFSNSSPRLLFRCPCGTREEIHHLKTNQNKTSMKEEMLKLAAYN